MIYSSYYSSPVGKLLLTSDGIRLTGLWIEKQKYFASAVAGCCLCENNNLPVLVQAKKWLDNYFQGMKPNIFELPLAPSGSDFRQAVWRILCTIPYGKVMTYGNIAEEIAVQQGLKRMSAQAVGGAVAHNPISIIIPCHRVVGTDGSLTGYAGGLDVKTDLLKLEGVDLSLLFRPVRGTAL